MSSCVAPRPYSCQRSTRARARAGPLMRAVRRPHRRCFRAQGCCPRDLCCTVGPAGLIWGLGVHSWPFWAKLGSMCRVVAIYPASGQHWSCLDPFGSDSLLSLPVCCQRCSHMHLPCCMRLSYAFMPLRCGTRVCCLHACFAHTSWDTWTACSSRDPLWSPLDLVGPGPRSVPESAVLFSLSFSASQTPSSLNASFSATLPCEREKSQRPQPAHLLAR